MLLIINNDDPTKKIWVQVAVVDESTHSPIVDSCIDAQGLFPMPNIEDVELIIALCCKLCAPTLLSQEE